MRLFAREFSFNSQCEAGELADGVGVVSENCIFIEITYKGLSVGVGYFTGTFVCLLSGERS